MMEWYRCNLGDAQLVEPQLSAFKVAFREHFVAAGEPADMAVFIRHESERHLHCEVVLYFSPAAERPASALHSVVCEKPSPGDLGLFMGDEAAWSVLFPDYVRL